MFDKRSFNWFLTYSQVQLDDVQFNDAFWGNAHIAGCDGFVLARESHADGGTHYHAIVCYHRTKRIRSHTAFDLIYNGESIHGNYQPIRRLQECYDYVTKDGNFVEDIDGIAGLSSSRKKPNYWEEALQQSTKEEALRIIRKHNPEAYLKNRMQLDYGLDKHFEVREELAPPPYARGTFTNVPDALDDWVRTELNGWEDRRRSLFIIGPSRTGKTSWARSLGEHIYCMSSIVPGALKNRPKDCDYIVFDDIEQSTLDKSQLASNWKVFVGCQRHLTINEKYKPAETVNWGIPSIWCLNKMLDFSDMDFLHLNAVIVYVNDKIY